jgi:hypothetical protein
LQPRAYRGRKRKPIALEGAIVGTACGTTVLADSVCSCATTPRTSASLPNLEPRAPMAGVIALTSSFAVGWYPVTAADRVIRWTTTVTVIDVAAVAAVVSHEHAHAAATVKMSGHVEPWPGSRRFPRRVLAADLGIGQVGRAGRSAGPGRRVRRRRHGRERPTVRRTGRCWQRPRKGSRKPRPPLGDSR